MCLQIAVSIASHIQDLPELTHTVRFELVDNPTKEALTAKWQEWIQEAGDESQSMASVQEA